MLLTNSLDQDLSINENTNLISVEFEIIINTSHFHKTYVGPED